MTLLTFTADSTTDQLTSVGHGINTGDGPGLVRNVNGSLPGGLVTLTDYWFIRVDADHLKVATSNANALAGTAVDITSNGTGTQYLGIGLPYRRPRTYTANSILKSADVNALFDDDINAYNLSITRQFSIMLAVPTTATKSAGSTTAPIAPRLILGTSTDESALPVDFPAGCVITGFSVKANKTSAAGTITVKCFEANSSGGTPGMVQIGSTQTNNANNPGDITLSQTGLTFQTTAGRAYYLTVAGGGTTGDTVLSYSVTTIPAP